MARPVGGKIHALPIKVSYTVEGSGSYCTILNERHDVYVHPAVPYHASARIGVQGHGGPVTRGKNGTPVRNGAGVHGGAGAGGQSRGGAVMGSCCLRDVAWGVCYASPECVPAPRYHDFSVYTLDPSQPIAGPSRLSSTPHAPSGSGIGGSSASNTPVPAHRRASHQNAHPTSSPALGRGTSPHPYTPPSTNSLHGANGHGYGHSHWAGGDTSTSTSTGTGTPGPYAWHGKGFLSWALYEPAPGTTLIRGRLIKSADFDGVAVEGGLEGLMAAAAAAERGKSAASSGLVGTGRSGSGAGGHGASDDPAHAEGEIPEEEEGDEQGVWGLEVELNLRMVNLGGRSVGDKDEFREMIAKGKDASSGAGAGAGNAPAGQGAGVSGVGSSAVRPQGYGTAGRTGVIQGQGQGRQQQPVNAPGPAGSRQSGNVDNAQPMAMTHGQNPLSGPHHQPQTIPPTNGQERVNAPRRIEPRLLSQPDKSPQSGPGRIQALRTSTGASTPIHAPAQGHPHGASGHAQGSVTAVRPGSSDSRSDSLPMDRSSSRKSDSNALSRRDSSQNVSSATGSSHPSSSGTDEAMFHPPSDTTPRAQRGATRPNGLTREYTSSDRRGGQGGCNGNGEESAQQEQSGGSSDSDREVTPPPIARPMGPPCTPGARAALASLLGPDGRMSPTAVKALANSSTFRKLLALAPISPLKAGQGGAQGIGSGQAAAQEHAAGGVGGGGTGKGKGKDGSLKSPFGSSIGASASQIPHQTRQHQQQHQRGHNDSDMGAKDPMNPFLSHPPAFAGPPTHRPSSASKPGASQASQASSSSSAVPMAKPSPAGSDIPTPASTTSFYAPSVKPEPTSSSAQAQGFGYGQGQGQGQGHGQGQAQTQAQGQGAGAVACPSSDGCSNCSTMYSSQWLQKKRSGVAVTVCYDCGLYFNAHRAMRPKELWGSAGAPAAAVGAGAGAAAGPGENQGGSRQVGGGDAGGGLDNNKRAKVEGPTGVRSSPRRTGTRASNPAHPSSSAPEFDSGASPSTSAPVSASAPASIPPCSAAAEGGPTDSPRRKKRPPPPPSPRRATRAAVKEHPEAFPDVDLDLIFGTGPGASGASMNVDLPSGPVGSQKGDGVEGMAGSTGTGSASAVSMQLDGGQRHVHAQSQGQAQGGQGGEVDFDMNDLFGTAGTAGTVGTVGVGPVGVQGINMGIGVDTNMNTNMGMNMDMDMSMGMGMNDINIDNIDMDNIDFDALLAQFVNEGGDVGQLWDLGAGMGMELGGDMGVGMDTDMGVGMGMDIVNGVQGAQGMQGSQMGTAPTFASGASGLGANAMQGVQSQGADEKDGVQAGANEAKR